MTSYRGSAEKHAQRASQLLAVRSNQGTVYRPTAMDVEEATANALTAIALMQVSGES